MPQSTMQTKGKQLFENGYGVSLIQESDGETFEIAVLSHKDRKYVRLVYDTGITSDVIRYSTNAEVIEVIERVRQLPPK
jgi:hypothetical protein